jgi:1-aminocyclopropane-1-carboxylate deaminase/D-cysteine desulfhydrase-like pyridoxal-dependent ACC family enzyme
MISLLIPSPVQVLHSAFLESHELSITVKRDDLIHPEISGNKWRKLKYNLEQMKKQGGQVLLTFGGAYSNHIAATAALGKHYNISTVGVIRGDEGFSNSTLEQARENGMKLHFIDRITYKEKNAPHFLANLKRQFGDFYLVPEGGANELGVKGCEEILREEKGDYNYVIVAAGTGTTASGICRSLIKEKLLVFPALKGGGFILEEMKEYCSQSQLAEVELVLDYHFGGFGKMKPELLRFMNAFHSQYELELDRIYTSKMFFGLFSLIEQHYFPKGSKLLVIHTGGLQGNTTLSE